jgi:hypothetical protein
LIVAQGRTVAALITPDDARWLARRLLARKTLRTKARGVELRIARKALAARIALFCKTIGDTKPARLMGIDADALSIVAIALRRVAFGDAITRISAPYALKARLTRTLDGASATLVITDLLKRRGATTTLHANTLIFRTLTTILRCAASTRTDHLFAARPAQTDGLSIRTTRAIRIFIARFKTALCRRTPPTHTETFCFGWAIFVLFASLAPTATPHRQNHPKEHTQQPHQHAKHRLLLLAITKISQHNTRNLNAPTPIINSQKQNKTGEGERHLKWKRKRSGVVSAKGERDLLTFLGEMSMLRALWRKRVNLLPP